MPAVRRHAQTRPRARALLTTALLACLPFAAVAQSATPVMSGLQNPRGLAFGPEGALYVAEAGRGGSGPCAVLRGQARCYGPSGAVSRLWRGKQRRVVTGLPSYADAAGLEATGPHDIAFAGRGSAFVTTGFGGDPAERDGFGGFGRLFGALLQVTPGNTWRVVADVSAHEGTDNPAGGPVDSNPYGVLVQRGARLVADAGANALLRVSPGGKVSTIATFRVRAPDGTGTDAVPTVVERGPDGALYVGELTGAPFLEGMANVYRIGAGGVPTLYAGGFKTIIDMDFGPDGSLYVLQHATGPMFFAGPGQVVRVAPDGSRSVVIGGLDRPTSVLVGRRGAIFVTNRGTSMTDGEVLRIDP